MAQTRTAMVLRARRSFVALEILQSLRLADLQGATFVLPVVAALLRYAQRAADRADLFALVKAYSSFS